MQFETIMSCFYLFFSVCCSYSAFTQTLLIPMTYFVGASCSLDIVLHITRIRYMRSDMFLHHICALLIVAFCHNHFPLVETIDQQKNTITLITQIISSEISTIFLVLSKIIREKRWIGIIQILFISTFTYYRLYKYTFYVIMNLQTTFFIIYISKNEMHCLSMFYAIYGLYFINIYWFVLIVKKIVKKMSNNPPANIIIK